MSTWLYLKCLDHDPPLIAADESGQHLYDLPQIRADLADRESLLAAAGGCSCGSDLDYFRRHSATFLAQHRKCRIGIEDEYGVEYSADAQADDEIYRFPPGKPWRFTDLTGI